MPFNPVIYNPKAGLAAGINQASDALSNAGSNIGALQRIGLMHLRDQQAGTVLDAFKQQGFDQDPAMKALFNAADKGPLGTKSAVLGIAQNYINMAQQIRLLQAKRGIEGGRFVNPNAGGFGGSGSGSGSGDPSSYELNTPPPNPKPSTIDVSGTQNQDNQ